MKNNTLASLRDVICRQGYSIPEMNFLDSQNPQYDVASLYQKNFFSKSDAQIIEEMIEAKHELCRDLYKIDACPFELLTGVNWEEMFRRTVLPVGDYDPKIRVKMFTPWYHMIVNSKDMDQHSIQQIGRNPELLIAFEHVGKGKELVKIQDTLYIYGEVRIVAERVDIYPQRDPFHLRLLPSGIVIDERLVEPLKAQEEYYEVMELLYLIFYFSGHSPSLHSVFSEAAKSIGVKIKKDKLLCKLMEKSRSGFNIYEMNFLRMKKREHDLICKYNPQVSVDLRNALTALHYLTRNWDFVLKEYMRSISFVRVDRIENFAENTRKIETYRESLLIDGGTHLGSSDNYINMMIHDWPQYEALVYDKYGWPTAGTSFSHMTRSMFDLYV